jgi:hypothetical protein
MAKVLPGIMDHIRDFIAEQSVFFVASAPLSADGHVNLSPKGLDTFRVLGPDRVAYLDLTGSGNETAAHMAENGRITLMFCAFDGNPMILRLFGRGRSVLPGSAEWSELIGEFEELPGARQIIVAEIDRVQTSCGWGVPLMATSTDRDKLIEWADRKGTEGLAEYWREKNATSIDGLSIPVAE